MESNISNRLWKYNPDDDSWLLMTRFPGIKRSYFNLVVNNDKIFLIGGKQEEAAGKTFMDCWVFTPSENVWNLNSFIPKRSQSGIAFSWNSKIIFGMNYYQNWDITYDSNLYELN
jgi:N-acetylneuraminic acid mutarotase